MHERFFCLKIQAKYCIIEAIVDPGSQKNLIYENLVQKLGLQSKSNLYFCPIGWIQKVVELKISKMCIFKFSITEREINDATCEIVALDVCQVIYESLYVVEMQSSIDGRGNSLVKFMVNASKTRENVDLAVIQAERLVNTCSKIGIIVREVDATQKAKLLSLGSTD